VAGKALSGRPHHGASNKWTLSIKFSIIPIHHLPSASPTPRLLRPRLIGIDLCLSFAFCCLFCCLQVYYKHSFHFISFTTYLYSYHSLTTGFGSFGSFGNYRRFCSCIIISIIVIALGPVINVQSNYLITDLQLFHTLYFFTYVGMQLFPHSFTGHSAGNEACFSLSPSFCVHSFTVVCFNTQLVLIPIRKTFYRYHNSHRVCLF